MTQKPSGDDRNFFENLFGGRDMEAIPVYTDERKRRKMPINKQVSIQNPLLILMAFFALLWLVVNLMLTIH